MGKVWWKRNDTTKYYYKSDLMGTAAKLELQTLKGVFFDDDYQKEIVKEAKEKMAAVFATTRNYHLLWDAKEQALFEFRFTKILGMLGIRDTKLPETTKKSLSSGGLFKYLFETGVILLKIAIKQNVSETKKEYIVEFFDKLTKAPQEKFTLEIETL